MGLSKVDFADRLSLDTFGPQANAEPDTPSGFYVTELPRHLQLKYFSPPTPKVQALGVPAALCHVTSVGLVILSCDYMCV